jgi:hypothetical protein
MIVVVVIIIILGICERGFFIHQTSRRLYRLLTIYLYLIFLFFNSPFFFLYSLSVYSAAGLRTDNKTKRVFPFLFRILSPSSLRERKEKSRSCLNCLVQSCAAHGPGPLSLLLTSLSPHQKPPNQLRFLFSSLRSLLFVYAHGFVCVNCRYIGWEK